MQCGLPPDVVITRWGTWLTAAVFFATHYDDFVQVVDALPDEDSAYTKDLKNVLQKTTLPSDLAFINSYLSFLPGVITKLETRGLSLNDQINIVRSVRTKIGGIPGVRGKALQDKADQVFQKNEGFKKLEDVSDAVLAGARLLGTMSPAVASAYTNAPLVSVDVERSFSDYKILFTDRRHSFLEANIEQHLLVMFNSRFL